MESEFVEVNIAEIKEKFIGTFPHSLGVEILSLEPGYSKIKMTVTQQMLNLHGMAHGGAIFTLADSALGLAANKCSYSCLFCRHVGM
jgi:acyl-CoA thioesterase